MADGNFSLIDAAAPYAVELFSELIGEAPKKQDANTVRWRINISLVYFHDGRRFYDHTEGAAYGFLDMLAHLGACSREEAAEWLAEWLRRRGAIEAQKSSPGYRCPKCGAAMREVREYVYRDAFGDERFKKLRIECSRRPECDGKTLPCYRREGGKWVAGWNGETPPPYRLDEWFASSVDELNVVEGEKCADALRLFSGKLVTTLASKELAPETVKYFQGSHIVFWPDADESGLAQFEKQRDALADVAASLSACIAIDAFPTAADKIDALTRFYCGGKDVADMIEKRILLNDLYKERYYGFWA